MTGAAAGNGPGQATGAARLPGQAPAPAAPAAPAGPTTSPTVQPFLTPTQQAALTAWNVKYADDLSQLGENDTLAWAKYNQGYAADEFKNANQVDMTNQSMGARGMFMSSIRDNALNDLAVTLAQQQTALQTARDAAIFKDQTDRTTLGAQNTSEQVTYNTDAVANAQAITPTVTTPSANQIVNTPTTPRPSGATPANPNPPGTPGPGAAPGKPIRQPNSGPGQPAPMGTWHWGQATGFAGMKAPGPKVSGIVKGGG